MLKRSMLFIVFAMISITLIGTEGGSRGDAGSGGSDPVSNMIAIADSISKNGPFNVMLAFVMCITGFVLVFVFKYVKSTADDIHVLKSTLTSFVSEISAKMNKVLADASDTKLIPPYAYHLLMKLMITDMMRGVKIVVYDGIDEIANIGNAVDIGVQVTRIGNEVQEVYRTKFQETFNNIVYDKADKMTLSVSIGDSMDALIDNIKDTIAEYPAENMANIKARLNNMLTAEENEFNLMLDILKKTY